MTDFYSFFKQFWEIILLLSGGIGSLVAWRANRKKSNDMIISELEKMKQLVVSLYTEQVSHAIEMSEKKRILNELKHRCPMCYEDAIRQLGLDGKKII